MTDTTAAPSPADKRALLAQLLRKKLSEVRTRPASFAQERLWFLHQLSPHSPFYNVPYALRLTGELDVAALQASLGEIVCRHEVLRTTFKAHAGQPVQVIAPAQPICLPVTDLQPLPEVERQAEARRRATVEAQLPFDLEQGPLLRLGLLRLAAQEHLLLVSMHHIITDGWSLGVFVRELGRLYAAYRAGRTSPLPALPLQYADFAAMERERLQGDALERQLAYWREALRGVQVLSMPTDRPRPAAQSFRGAAESFLMPKAISDPIQALCRREGVTPFMALLALFQMLLGRYSGQDDIAVGTPLANRTRVELEGLIGFFVNTLVLRVNLSGNPTFRELLRRVREVALGGYANPDVPFERLVAELQPRRDLSRNPLFQVMFALQNVPLAPLQLPGLTVSLMETEEVSSTFDLSLSLRETAQGLAGWCEYDTDLFDRATIRRLLRHYQRLTESAVADPGCGIADLPVLTEPERHLIVVEWNRTRADFPRGRCLHELISEQAARTPDAAAVAGGGRELTYRDLEERANRLARRLCRLGVRPEVPVAVCVERSPELILALLGALKAGGAYLPLDPTYPSERLALLVRDAQAPVIVTTRGLRDRLPAPEATVVCLDADWEKIARESAEPPGVQVSPDHLAYVIYTSGSSGMPKAVAVSHGAAVSHFTTFARKFGFRPGDRALQFSSLAVDFSLEDIFPTLLMGATVVFRGPDLWEPAEFAIQVCMLGITVLNLPTAYWHELARQLGEGVDGWEALCPVLDAQVRSVEIGGEAASPEAVRIWRRAGLTSVRLFNSYGPTEASVTATTYDIPAHDGDGPGNRVPIGRPLPNRHVYVLDPHGQPNPIGVPGELYLGGACLARGYLNAPDLTAERFVPDPFGREPGARLYRTGDLARWLPDGNLEFLGRIDQQIKVRGFRIEPGEIEAILCRHPRVSLAHVLAREDSQGNKRLVAFVVARHNGFRENGTRDACPTGSELRAYLREHVPEHMVPADFVFLGALPLLANGKVDERSLPVPDRNADGPGEESPPRTRAEETLTEIWRAVLGVERVGIHDNFFELGGDSILSIQVITRAKKSGLHLTPRQMFQHQTIAELAAVASADAAPVAAPEKTAGPVPLTPIQRWFFEQESPEPHHYNMTVLLQVRTGVDPDLLGRAIEHVAASHEALHHRFVRGEEGWLQSVVEADHSTVYSRVDLSSVPAAGQPAAIEAAAARLQSSLDLAAGPITKAAFFDLGTGQPGRLVWVVHHLAMDGVSWRILLQDLQAAYRQFAAGEAAAPPPDTTPFSQWARRLAAHAASPELRKEAAYWLDDGRQAVRRLPVDLHADNVTMASAASVEVSLTEAETRSLLQELPAAYRVQINDLLLAALAGSLTRWTGDSRVLLDLEGHGREALFDDLDLSRTVGWFTSVFPVFLDLGRAERADQRLRVVKEHLRLIPLRGVGYGLLRYLGPDEHLAERLRALPQAEVCFNYLGQFDQVLAEGALFGPAHESIGPSQSPRGRLSYLLEINAWITGGRLHADWTYSTAVHHRATLQRLADGFCEGLRALIERSRVLEATGYTPSDFPAANLSQAELDRLLGAYRKPRGGTP